MVRDELTRALSEMRMAPFFNEFIKTLQTRKDDIVSKILTAPSSEVDVLRGEARAYDFILKAAASKS